MCRAKWNAYTEDQLIHNGQGQGSRQYWEEHLKQVGARHALLQSIRADGFVDGKLIAKMQP